MLAFSSPSVYRAIIVYAHIFHYPIFKRLPTNRANRSLRNANIVYIALLLFWFFNLFCFHLTVFLYLTFVFQSRNDNIHVAVGSN